MDFSRIVTLIFSIAFIVVLYFIIYYALKIMYRDVKSGSKSSQRSSVAKNFGIEVLSAGDNLNLEQGSILLLTGTISMGRREGNTIKLDDRFASGNHAKVKVENGKVIIEDLDSTNGVFVNEERIQRYCELVADDKIKIGSAIFKVIRADRH